MYPPDGLLTFEGTKHDVKYDPRIIAADPSITDDIDDLLPVDLCLATTSEELNMNTSEDDPSPSLNGRLRPRKSHVPSPQGKTKIKPDGKATLDKPKRTNTPSKASPNKQDDLASKSDCTNPPQFLCPYCDKKFASRQTVSKHLRRIHYPTPKQDTHFSCLFCNHTEVDSNLIQHMVDSHPNQYFACLDCHTRFSSTSELAEHKLNVCEKQKITFLTKPRPKIARGSRKSKKSINISTKGKLSKHGKEFQEGHGFNGIVISCELKPPQDPDGADIEDNITTNLILPHSKKLGSGGVLEKNAVIVLDDIQWNKRIPPNFSFHNTDPDQILSRLGVVHRSPRTGESTKKEWFKALDDATQKFERCFDTKFYSKVASNVQENLTKCLDGSFNFKPDPDSTIKTRKSINNVAINTAEGFPILLASEQYSRNVFDGYMPRAIAPKHKWKWDNLENDRSLMTAAEILKRDSHTNNCIITLVSSLDIWTQLCMRRKFDDKFHVQPIEKKTEKQNIINKELKEILESREIPKTSQIVKRRASKPLPRSSELEFPASLGLVPATPTHEVRPAVLSGEWVRPRCLVCCACGEQTTDCKGLAFHMSTRHPNASVQCYEIVGEPLLNADILKHLYVPPSQVSNRTRPPRGFRECTKCNKSITLDDLHQHMLDCAGDTPTVRRRQPRQRPFGVRRRRPRMPDNTIRKKLRKDLRLRRQKTHVGPRIRTEVGDAETIRKMLADLPAKRHRVLVNPLNMIQRPCRKLDMQRSKLILKKCSSDEVKNRKRNINKTNSRQKEDSTLSVNQNKTMSSFDDDDNKPLKPKIKLATTTTFRRREPLKRQAVISTAKRRSVRSAKRKICNADKNEASNGVVTQESSLGKSPNRPELTKAPYNTREHAANRGTSSNRDGQRPGCSGTNGTANNSCAPAQNVPLKHSIARLTANSETHDKSVQFHHSFLVQQECNNPNQHDPTGDHPLFENEAVVSKLDKPPLNFCQKGFLDIQSFQKNKSNKPRKGLNDCIAMLKNKLVDPMPSHGTSYVSVQCGSDEPIDEESRIIFAKKYNVSSVQMDKQPEPQEHQHQNRLESTENSNHLKKNDPSLLNKPENISKAKQIADQTLPQKETTLLNYRRNSSDAVEMNPEKLQSTQPEQEIVRKIKSAETMQLYKKNDIVTQQEHKNSETIEGKSNVSHTQEKFKLVSSYGQETNRNVNKSSEFSDTECTDNQEESNTKTHLGKKNDQQSTEREQRLQGHNNELPQFAQEYSSKIEHDLKKSQIQGEPPKQNSTQKLKKQTDFLPVLENLSTTSHFRQELPQEYTLNPETSLSVSVNAEPLKNQSVQKLRKLKDNIETTHVPENFTYIPHYRQVSAQKSSDAICQEKVSTLPQQRKDYTLSYQKNREFPLDCEMKIHGKELSVRTCTSNDSGQSRGAENVKELDKRRFNEQEPVKFDKIDIKTSWQNPLDVFPNKSGTSQLTNKPGNYYEPDGVVLLNNAEILESDLFHSQSLDMFEDNRITDISSSIPPAHASNIVESIISAPLDLSSKVSTITHLSNSDSYDNYGTLDLSNKNANRRNSVDFPEEDVIVDLRVKSYSRCSPVTLDLCVKPSCSTSGDITEVISDVILHSVPTDLSVRGNDCLNKLRKTAVAIQDPSSTTNKTFQTTPLSKPSDDNEDMIKSKRAQKMPINEVEKTHSAEFVTKTDSNSAEFVTKSPKLQKANTNTTTLKDQPYYITKEKEVLETVVAKTQFDSNLTTGQLQKHIYDPTLKIPQYKIRANVTVTTTATSQFIGNENKTTPASAAIVLMSLPQDLTLAQTTNTSDVLKSKITSSKMTSMSSVVATEHNSGQLPLNSGCRIENTASVYTLANTCIAATKIEPNKLNNASQSLSGSTTVSAVPVNTPTRTTVGFPTSHSHELVNGSAKNHHFLYSSPTTPPNDNVISDAPISTHISDKILENEGFENNLPADQDSETAKKIAMLPKELVDILGNMPIDHRNQLLNVLPQYVSTTVANSVTATNINQTVSNSIGLMSKPVDGDVNESESEKTLSASSSSHTFKHLLKPDVYNPLSSSGQILGVDNQHHCMSYKKTLHKHEKSTENSDFVHGDLKSTVEKSFRSFTVKETEGNMSHLFKPNIDNIQSLNSDTNRDRVIDLTDDEISPPVIEISRSISASPKDLSISGISGIATKQKGNSDKTASLRAVRIRAPSLRQREKQKLNLLSEEQVLTQNEKDVVMQLAEMSMLHSNHDHKTFIDPKNSVNILPVDTAGKESLNLSFTSAETSDDKVVKACDSNTISGALSVPDLPSNKENNTRIEIKNTNAMVIDPATENNLTYSGDIFSTSENLDNNNVNNEMPIKENKNISTQEEEDSEDDIILASIVKQKQNIKATKSKRNIKKNDKKRKNNTKPDLNITIFKNSIPISKNDNSLVNVVENSHNKLDSSSNTPIFEYSKLKGRSKNNSQNDGQKLLGALKFCKEINKRQMADSKIESSCLDNLFVECGKENKDKLSNVITHSQIETPNKTKSQETLLANIEHVLPNDKPKKRKRLSDEHIYSKTEQDKAKGQLQVLTSFKSNEIDLVDVPIKENKNAQSINTVLKTDDIQARDDTIDSSSDIVELKTGVKHIEICNKNKGNLINETEETDYRFDTPLRRSQRGKLNYPESNFPHESCVESAVDQKAPLTKKQLIFSKLLLDEEQTKSLKSIPEQNENLIDEIDTLSTVSNVISKQTNKTDKSENSIETCKLLKRKKSPRPIQKSKKKKSISNKDSPDNIAITVESVNNLKDNSKLLISATEESLPTKEKVQLYKLEDQLSDKFVSCKESACDKKYFKSGEEIIQNRHSLEKGETRKSPPISDSDHITKTGKSKISKLKGADSQEEPEKVYTKLNRELEHSNPCTKPDTPFTTCYDVPVAARRTRSKSVAVKPSCAASYDPYDIDLDDMIQKPEPLRKTNAKTKEIKTKGKSSSKLANLSELHEKQHKDPANVVDKAQKITPEPSPLLSKRKGDSKATNFSKVKKFRKTSPMVQSANEINNLHISQSTHFVTKDTISDSDESSKSDVPLNKYLENKVKKMRASKAHSRNKREDKSVKKCDLKFASQKTTSKKKLFTQSLSKNIVDTRLSDDIEEQMRSEQFMESFGFFSERKPRKSNLLATKKISETFHIIANENDDLYYSSKEKYSRKSLQIETRKKTEGINMQHSSLKKNIKRGRKKKNCTKTYIRFCDVCKHEFRRADNYVRHQMNLVHISKLSEVVMKVKTVPIQEKPNYLIAYKEQMARLKILTEKAAIEKKKSRTKTKIVLPSSKELFAEAHKTIMEHQAARRRLNRDEASIADCCEFLKKPRHDSKPSDAQTLCLSQSLNSTSTSSSIHMSGDVQISSGAHTSSDAHTSNGTQSSISAQTPKISSYTQASKSASKTQRSSKVASVSASSATFISDSVEVLKKSEAKKYDVNSRTARTILESKEVRNWEHDSFSNEKKGKKERPQETPSTMTIHPHEISEIFLKPNRDSLGSSVDTDMNKTKKPPEYKEKMYPDIIEDIDMFEDKFDKIKRKCRSQAAAAKQILNVREPSPGYKGKKKTEKKKGKSISKKNYQNPVMTKGALKGFDGIKVSIPTSDINMSAIVAPHENSPKKKRKPNTKKKREKDSETSGRSESDHRLKDGSYSHKKVDVYEFMDNEDAELFEFRPSTLMERFKSINKDTPDTSKDNESTEDIENSSESASDGDDFVYMSDDYVCSDDETENSSLSCELANSKNDAKKSTHLKRKDVVEKNAVMGKIFKHNAVRTEKKNVKSKESAKPKANLDQLFDSLLEEKPNSTLNNDSDSPKLKKKDTQEQRKSKCESISPKEESKSRGRKPSMSPVKLNIAKPSPSTSKGFGELERSYSSSLYDVPERYHFGPSTSKQVTDIYAPSTSAAYIPPEFTDESITETRESSQCKKENISLKSRKSPVNATSEQEETCTKSSFDKLYDFGDNVEIDEDTGVARHRARRKCTVGKQNVLAETWSSESEPDGLPPRPASAESRVVGGSRKKKGKKRDGQQALARRGKVSLNKKQDTESRVISNKKNTSGNGETSHCDTGSEKSGAESIAVAEVRDVFPPPAPPGPSTSGISGSEASTSKANARAKTFFWTSEGDDEQEHHQQQHGWIVGNSHKRLVTMLAHAKGRKRNNDDKGPLVE